MLRPTHNLILHLTLNFNMIMIKNCHFGICMIIVEVFSSFQHINYCQWHCFSELAQAIIQAVKWKKNKLQYCIYTRLKSRNHHSTSIMATAQVNVKFITNRRGGQNLAFHGYIYRIHRRTDTKLFWRCTATECSAKLSTENNIPAGFGRQPHTHPADHTETL